MSLEEGGKVTSHLVKYAHHRDGEAHFSQTGKVTTLIRRNAVPLNLAAGHLFTVQIQGLDGFDEAAGPDYDYDNIKDKPITFDVIGVEPQGVKLVGSWYNKRELRQRVREPEAGPGVTLLSDDGARAYGLLLSAPTGKPGAGSYVVLTVSRIPPLARGGGSHLTFIGGFDARDVIHDHARPTGFLALSYPTGDYEGLAQAIGTINLRRAIESH